MSHYKQPATTDQRRSSFHQAPSANDSFGSFNSSFNDHAVSDLKLSDPRNAPVKMVKKYIPTPTGIKVVEVPESNFAKEVARSNSLRSGPNMYRSGSMNSLSGSRRIPRSLSLTNKPSPAVKQSLRLSSLQGKGMSVMAETEEVADVSDDVKDHQKKLEALQKQIDNEKKMARELDAMRSEFEKLKAERLRKERDLETVAADPESEEEDVPIVDPPFAVDELDKKALQDSSSPILRPNLGSVDNTITDTISDKSSTYTDEVIPDASIDASAIVVDELEKKNVIDDAPTEEEFSTLDPHPNAEHGALDFAPVVREAEFVDEPEVEDAPDLEVTSSILKPLFDPSPEYIDSDDSKNLVDLLHLPPTMNNISSSGSSVRSNGTLESPNHKSAMKPKKSAIKNSSSFYDSALPANAQKANPAREAYISLTTAENTRLNSKLSSSQLGDALAVNGFASHHYPAANNNSTKRQSVSRKPPQSPQVPQGSGMAHKTLRPNSEVFNHGHPHNQAGVGASAGGMSNRSLRDRSSYVAPIAPHPALQPNYQSPSKQKAAELYAKANARPMSQFKPRPKRSSFGRENDGVNGSEPPSRVTRTTLRDGSHSVPAQAQPPNNQPISHNHRILSSSDLESSSERKFISRIENSDDEDIPHAAAVSAATHPVESARLPEPDLTEKRTLRDIKVEEPKQKGKKKFGKLRKLFGRNDHR